MSKIPADQNGAKRPTHLHGLFTNNFNMSYKSKELHETSDRNTTHLNIPPDIGCEGKKEQTLHKAFVSLIPKKSFHLDKTATSSRILSFREKLNEMSKKQESSVDKKTKCLINDITQRCDDEKHEDESGPYSLLMDLQTDQSSSSKDIREKNGYVKYDVNQVNAEAPNVKSIVNFINKTNEKQPYVISFDEKSLREFELSCESEGSFMIKKTCNNLQSRSELCLQLNSHPRTAGLNLSPNDNSLHRANEENSLDDSLGILTPDQMDDICYLENAFSPTVEGLPTFASPNESKISPGNGDTPSTDKTESNSAASTIQNDGFEPTSDEKKAKESHQEFNNQSSGLSVDEIVLTASPFIRETDIEQSYNKHDCEEVLPLIEEDFMPSINSSILEPLSSVTEKTVNLEMHLDCKKSFVDVIRIEQTPSPEDLPLDSSDVNCVSTCSQFSVSTMHDTDSKNENTKSMETSKVSNSFITSITSITSLDGYQGDGEMSRPVSRGGDHSIGLREEAMEMDWQNVPVTRRADPMTDSDFFTESDADGFDEHMQRGDRRAQVIDGALYRGKNGKANPALIVNNRNNDDSCMESSGVFTDFDNQRASPVFLNVINDMSPEATTPSTRSECSQNNGKSNGFFAPANNNSVDLFESPTIDEEETPKNTSKRNSLNTEKELRGHEKNVKEEKRFTLKKYKMPKRDVPSKLKTMLTSKKEDLSLQNSPKVVKKTDRRENLSKKNTLEVKGDHKTKSYKDIKSKVDCSFSLQRSQTACSVTRLLSSKSTSNNNKPKSRHMRMRMDLGSANGSGKSSLHSSQSDISAPSALIVKQNNARFPLLRNGKKRESVQPSATPRPPASPPQPPSSVKKNGVVQKLAYSPVTIRTRTSLAPPPSPRKPPATKTTVQRPTTLPTNKEPPRVTPAVGPRSKRAQTPQPAARTPAPLPAPLPAPPEQAAALAHAAKGVEALGVLVQYLVFRLDALNGGSWRAEADKWRSVAKAERTSAARADRDRQQRAQKDLDTIAECLKKISELEIEVSSKEEVNARLQATHVEEVAALASDIKGLKETIESLKHEVAESRARLHAHSEIERTLRAQLEAARAEIDRQRLLGASNDQSFKRSSSVSDAACDPVHCQIEDLQLRISTNEELSSDANELAAEVRSLRAVIELKQAEMASLRDARSELTLERERRTAAEREARSAAHAAEELKERAAARQRDVDRLREENRRLREVAARDRDNSTRLQALNEELRYKLKQKSKVVSLLAGIDRHRPRTSSNDSNRSPSPVSPPSPASPVPTLPAVKGVVEKQDSVSWVLEIEESPEEVASRLTRKSSFRNTASPSGVKRRGGGSPGSSPAPSSPAPNASKLFRPGELDFSQPPPLKESAGEAIYIYDDRQY